MDRKFSHAMVDRINAAQDRRIAARLRRDLRVLKVARANLKRWMTRDGRKVRASFREWDRILTRLSRAEIADFLQSDTPLARRLRQSSPFSGVLNEAERQAIAGRHEKTGTSPSHPSVSHGTGSGEGPRAVQIRA